MHAKKAKDNKLRESGGSITRGERSSLVNRCQQNYGGIVDNLCIIYYIYIYISVIQSLEIMRLK
jgi:hypothetical protein